jgi:zinc protease
MGKAFALGQAIILEGNAAEVNRGLTGLQSVTASDVQRVLRKYVRDAKPVVINYVAEAGQ